MFKEIIEWKYKLLNGSQKIQIPSFIKKNFKMGLKQCGESWMKGYIQAAALFSLLFGPFPLIDAVGRRSFQNL